MLEREDYFCTNIKLGTLSFEIRIHCCVVSLNMNVYACATRICLHDQNNLHDQFLHESRCIDTSKRMLFSLSMFLNPAAWLPLKRLCATLCVQSKVYSADLFEDMIYQKACALLSFINVS